MADYRLQPSRDSIKSAKRIGRGPSSGTGKTSGKGHKGQKARSGGGVRLGFEGGQMPLFRRVAIRGFSNYPFKKIFTPINLFSLEKVYNDGEIVSLETLIAKNLIKRKEKNIKILGKGELTKKLTIENLNLSKSVRDKLEKAGCTIVEGS